MHHLKRREEIVLAREYESRARGSTRAALVDGSTGSVHMGLGLCRLEDGHVETHVHSFEESFYVLEGTPTLYLDGRGVDAPARRVRRRPGRRPARVARSTTDGRPGST